MRIGRSVLALAAGALALVAGPSTASAARPTLPTQIGGAHFLVHYDPATATAEYATAGLADFEEAYTRLVVGGGGTPNAGLRVPVSDGLLGGDARTDVYLMVPAARPDFSGGLEAEDRATFPDPLVDSGYLYMTPALSRAAFRVRAGHEFMHVIQDSYVAASGLLTESTAHWASEQALLDVEPTDNAFEMPWLPLDCSYGVWNGTPCGNGYGQWPFFERLTERFGLGFMDRLWTRMRAECACTSRAARTTAAVDRQVLSNAIAAEPGEETLATLLAEYAAALWNPKDWLTTAITTMHRRREPAATEITLTRDAPTAGESITVDHLATRYIRLRLGGPGAPGDAVRLTVTRPDSSTIPVRVLSGIGPDQLRPITTLTATSPGQFSETVSLDAATVTDVVLPLVNTGTSDGLSFAWQAQLVPAGAPSAPAGDVQSTPSRIQPRTTTVIDNAYAGGGAGEASSCATAGAATRGVWFVVRVDRGALVIDPRGSDFEAAVAVYDLSDPATPALWSCSRADARGLVSGIALARDYLVYVGRAKTEKGLGHTLRLAVDGTPPDVTAPAVSRLRLTPSKFRAAGRGAPLPAKAAKRTGTRLRFGLSESADLRFGFERSTTGRKVAGRCVKTTKRSRGRKPCRRYVEVGSVLTGLPGGEVNIPLSGRRSTTRALKVGAYRLVVVATDASGNASAPFTATFSVKR